MKISQLDNDIYEIESVLSVDDWKKVHAEFNPVYNNWIFKKKEFDQLPISERSTQTALFPTWGCVAKLVDDDGVGDNHVFLNTSVLVKFTAQKILQKRLELVRINTNIQYTGMESMYHQDGNDTEWTFLIFMSKFWEPNWGGEFVCWNDDDTYRGFPYIPNNGIMFRADLRHKGAAPNILCKAPRFTIAFTYSESSSKEEYDQMVKQTRVDALT